MILTQFFDIFGLVGFIILFIIGLKIVKQKRLRYYGDIILIISSLGIIADSYSIITNFLL